ncbi:hypothetical protein Tco_0087890 [Tanacetum coccineum]
MVAFLEKSTGSEGFHQVIDFLNRSHICYALTKKPDVYISFIKQFWRSAEATNDDNGEVQITATIDGHSKTITEASLRRHLKLDDHDGITSIPNSEIFEQLALMGYHTDSDKLTFQKGAFSPQWRFLIHTILHCLSPKKTAWEQFSSNIATACLKSGDWGNARKRARVVLSEDEEDDSFKQGRIDEDPNTYFAQDDEVVHDQDTAKEGQLEDILPLKKKKQNLSTIRETHSTTGRVVYGRRSKEARKDKGKAIMTEPEPEKKSKKLLEQERLGLEEAIRLQEKIDEEERAQDVDWNDPSVQKYWDMKNKPKSEAQARKNMIVYLKNQSNYKMKDFEGMSYDEIRPIFVKIWDFNHNFVPMDLEIEKEKKKPAEFQEIEIEQIEKDTTGKRKKSLPRKRTRSTTKRQKVELDDEKEDLKGYLDIVPREDVDSLSTKYPIMDWKTYTLSKNFMYYKIIRGDGSSKNYKILSEMLYDFDRQDIVELYRLVKERYSSSKPEGYDLMLWGDLHTLFEPDEESEIWLNQNEYNLISWSLCDFCGVHILLMQNGIAIHMLTEKKYPLSQEMISKMLSKRLEVDQESTQAYELLKFIRSQGRIVGNKSSSRVNTAKVKNRSRLGINNWYQSLVALDLGSTRFCRKVEDGVEGCKVRFLMVLFSKDTSGSWKSAAATKDIG